ncbi:MAG: hypothetical protein JKX75_07220 [Gammaproteobacteria bacterium]|nr:hypothetical protein [Gammaproteobacteria bacterium]
MVINKAISKFGLVCLYCSACYSNSLSANDDYQLWMQQQTSGALAQKKAFQEYKDKRDKEFTTFLKAQWKAVDIVKGNVRDEAPKPDVMPVAKPKPVALKPGVDTEKKVIPVNKPVVIILPEPDLTKKPVVVPVIKKPTGDC